tara:strand:- start:184 stop:1464 length:1281 start_codon:yes stop_codon:yes gene_type:complete
MILFYRALTNLFYPILVLIIFFRKLAKKEDQKRYKEKIFSSNYNVKKNNKLKLIWFHAASIGELKSIIPIIDQLNVRENSLEFLVTTITLSSANLAKIKFKNNNNIHHRFIPIDVKFLIVKFLDLWKPKAIFLVDSEIWPNLISVVKEKKIPLAILNARITNKTFNRWRFVSSFAESLFGSFDLCLTSNFETKEYLENLNAKNIHYIGNIKFCETIKKNIKNNNEIFLTSKNFWLAASTHNGEENFCLLTHLEIKKDMKNIVTIIAPRHVNRSADIKKLCDGYNLNCQILNSGDHILEDREIVIINSYGILSSFFKNSKSVFIGKSNIKKLKNVGGQNPIEAVKLGCKVYHGPFVYNFKEVYKILEKNNVSKEVNSPEELARCLLLDFKINGVKDLKFAKTIDNLGQKILSESLKKINNFLIYENK